MSIFLDTANPVTDVLAAHAVMTGSKAQGWAPYVGGPGAYQPAVKAWHPLLNAYAKSFAALLPVYVCRLSGYTADDTADALRAFSVLPQYRMVCLDLEPHDRTATKDDYRPYINRLVAGLRAHGKRVVLYSWVDVLKHCTRIANPPDNVWVAAPGKTLADIDAELGGDWRGLGRRAVQYGQIGNHRYDISITDVQFIAAMLPIITPTTPPVIPPPPTVPPPPHAVNIDDVYNLLLEVKGEVQSIAEGHIKWPSYTVSS